MKMELQYFLDIDEDGDQDLYVCSGGSEFNPGSSEYGDRLYLNDGQGNFTNSGQNFGMDLSTASATPLDIDEDGDLDLFVGGRQKPGEYGKRVDSYILINNQGQLKKYEDSSLDFLKEFGMVTHSGMADLNGDNKAELVVAGEWMPISVFEISDKKLIDKTEQYQLADTKGWWNTFEITDIDGDGDNDIIAGNLGHNIKYKASVQEPFKLYVDDFDQNGTNDVYLGFYENGQCFPVRGRQCFFAANAVCKEKNLRVTKTSAWQLLNRFLKIKFQKLLLFRKRRHFRIHYF